MDSGVSLAVPDAILTSQSHVSLWQWLHALYRFTRPESTFGSVVMSAAISLALLPALPYDSSVFVKITSCVLSLALWTIASHGINQIYDLPVDRINKPDFPLPSGVMSLRQAWAASLGTGIIGSLLALWAMPLWVALFFVGFMTWASITYSIPRFGSVRIRHSPLFTKLFGVTFRGIIYPTVTFFTVWSLSSHQKLDLVYLAFILTFAVLFCVGMNTFEDIPDMQGDQKGGYLSFALILGATKTAYISLAAFSLAFLSLIAWMLTFPQMFRIEAGLFVEALLLTLFIARFKQLLQSELQPNGGGAKPFYGFLWRLYVLQYVALIIIFAPSQLT